MHPKTFLRFPTLTLFVFSLAVPTLNARTLYVAGNGDDARDVSAPAAAFRSLQKAAQVVEPGDTVLVGGGKYTGDPGARVVLAITKSGRPAAWITWKARPGERPEVHYANWSGHRSAGFLPNPRRHFGDWGK